MLVDKLGRPIEVGSYIAYLLEKNYTVGSRTIIWFGQVIEINTLQSTHLKWLTVRLSIAAAKQGGNDDLFTQFCHTIALNNVVEDVIVLDSLPASMEIINNHK